MKAKQHIAVKFYLNKTLCKFWVCHWIAHSIQATLLKVRRYLLVLGVSTTSFTYFGTSLSARAIIRNAVPTSFLGCFGHSASGRFNHSGPFHQILEEDNWMTIIPRVGKSARFSFVGTHEHTPPTAVISSTRLATNTPHTRGPC